MDARRQVADALIALGIVLKLIFLTSNSLDIRWG
jgi:hypothetical protein